MTADSHKRYSFKGFFAGRFGVVLVLILAALLAILGFVSKRWHGTIALFFTALSALWLLYRQFKEDAVGLYLKPRIYSPRGSPHGNYLRITISNLGRPITIHKIWIQPFDEEEDEYVPMYTVDRELKRHGVFEHDIPHDFYEKDQDKYEIVVRTKTGEDVRQRLPKEIYQTADDAAFE